jgi:hypothetical protein
MFDKKKLGTAMAVRKGQSVELAPEVSVGEPDGLHEACIDLLAAIERKSPSDMAKAWRAGFEILESEPHVEAGEIES